MVPIKPVFLFLNAAAFRGIRGQTVSIDTLDFCQKCSSCIRVDKKSFQRSSSRASNVQVTSKRVGKHFFFLQYFFLPDGELFLLS